MTVQKKETVFYRILSWTSTFLSPVSKTLFLLVLIHVGRTEIKCKPTEKVPITCHGIRNIRLPPPICIRIQKAVGQFFTIASARLGTILSFPDLCQRAVIHLLKLYLLCIFYNVSFKAWVCTAARLHLEQGMKICFLPKFQIRFSDSFTQIPSITDHSLPDSPLTPFSSGFHHWSGNKSIHFCKIIKLILKFNFFQIIHMFLQDPFIRLKSRH